MRIDRRRIVREALLLVGFLIVIGPVGFATFGAAGLVAWAIVGERFVQYDDQYEWLAGCINAGRASGGVGTLASLAWWIGLRIRSAEPIGASGDDPAKRS